MDGTRGATQRVLDAYNAHDLRALRALYSPDARIHRPVWPAVGGVDWLLAAAKMDAVALPDLRIKLLVSAREGSRTLTEARIAGTNTGELVLGDFGRATIETTAGTVGATGRPRVIMGVIVHEVNEEGLVVAVRRYWVLAGATGPTRTVLDHT